MDYSLARQLKEVGFPQYDNEQSCIDNYADLLKAGNPEPEAMREAETCYIPSLSELIEACGERFALHKNKDHWVAWRINSNPRDREAHDTVYEDYFNCIHIIAPHYLERGQTPEIAVAKLWLVLNALANAGRLEALSPEGR